MKLKFIELVLFLILLIIIATDGLRNIISKINEEKPTVLRFRGSFQHNLRNSTSLESELETSLSNVNPITSNTSRRTPVVRQNSSKLLNVPNINNSISQEQIRIEAIVESRTEKSNIIPQKVLNYESARRILYQLVSKAPISNSEKTLINKDTNIRSKTDITYFSEDLIDKVKNDEQQNYSEIINNSKLSNFPLITGRKSIRLLNDKFNKKMDTTESAISTKVLTDLMSRTGRKIQNPKLLSIIQINNNRQPNLRFFQHKVEDNGNFNLTAEGAENNRSNFKRWGKTTVDDFKHDIISSGSESIRINIPLNFNDSRRIVSTTSTSDISSLTQLTKNSSILRDQLQGRKTIEDKKILQENVRRRNGSRKWVEVTSQVFPSRSRNDAITKTKTIIENNMTSSQPDFKRRKSNVKSLFRESGDVKKSEIKDQSQDNRKSNRSRGRQQIYGAITISSSQSKFFSTTELLPTPRSILKSIGVSSFVPETMITTTQLVTSAPITKLKTSSQSITTMITTLNSGINRRDTISERSSHQNTTLRRRTSKEDFFNHGLGFRGRRPPMMGIDQVPALVTSTTSTTLKPENIARGNPGWTLRRRPGHWHDSRPSGPLANPVASQTSIQEDKKTISTTLRSIWRAENRGNKTFSKLNKGGTKEETSESDNYPPDFKARLAQLQKSDGKPRSSVEASKMTSTEQFAARSRMKLENARKLIKPELLIDETKARQIIINPLIMSKEDRYQKVNDSEVDEDQKVFKITRKLSLSTENSQIGQKSLIKSDWKPTKLRKNFKETVTRFARYKQANFYTLGPKVPSTTTTSITEKSFISKNDTKDVFKSIGLGRYQEYNYKFVPMLPGIKFRGPKPSRVEGIIHDDNPTSTIRLPQLENPRKMFATRKNNKSYVEDIKAVTLKLRKNLESVEKNQLLKPVKRSDSMEGSTTLLTTMRTVKSFSFSTRLVKMEDNDSVSSTTMKMVNNEATSLSIPTSTSSSFITEINTQNPNENEITTSAYKNIETSSNHSTPYNIVNEIENVNVSSTIQPLIKKMQISEKMESNWKTWSKIIGSMNSRNDYQPRAAALMNDTGSPVYVVYPSAIEKPLSIAITPKVYKYQETGKFEEASSIQHQSVTQKPNMNVKVSSSDGIKQYSSLKESTSNTEKSNTIISQITNIFNPAKSTAILETGNITILEHLRSTVAPLLNTLGAKSPVFSRIYKNTNSANSLPRVTPSGSPPRFSARYGISELLLRRPIVATSTFQNSDSASQIYVFSASESKVSKNNQPVEAAIIHNKQIDDSERTSAQWTTNTNTRSNQTFTTVHPTISFPLFSAFSSNNLNTHYQSNINLQSTVSTETTPISKNNLDSLPSPIRSSTKSLTPIISSNTTTIVQQPITTNCYIRRIDTRKLNSAPKFSSSSSTPTPLRDYLIYGIYPNKTIVRKRPEDNLIDSKNLNSPYVIFGVYPDGKLVRKLPNGTVIPDPPSNPVEVIFSLSTSTISNRPKLLDNQDNIPGSPNKIINISNKYNRVADMNSQNGFYAPNEVDNALGFSGSIAFDLPIDSVDSNTKETMTVTTDSVCSNSSLQDGRIIKDRMTDRITRTNEDEGQRNTILIRQDDTIGHQPAVSERPIKKMMEIFNPVSNTINSLIYTPTKATTTSVPSIPTSTTISSIATPLITTITPETMTIQAPSSLQALTTMQASTTMAQTLNISNPSILLRNESPKKTNSNVFGTTFDDLVFLNALLEKPNSEKSTLKTLTEVEQLLANKILSLALGRTLTNSSSLRSSKAIQPSNASPNSFPIVMDTKFATVSSSLSSSSSQPIVIDLVSLSTTKRPSFISMSPYTWKPIRTFSSYQKPSTTSVISLKPSMSTTTPKIPTMTIARTTTTTTPKTITTIIPSITTMRTPKRTTTSIRSITTAITPRITTTSFTTQKIATKFIMPESTMMNVQKTMTSLPIITGKPGTVRRSKSVATQTSLFSPFVFAANLLQKIFGSNTFASTTPRPIIGKPTPAVKRVVLKTKKIVSTTTPASTTIPIHKIIQLQSSHTPIKISSDIFVNTNDQLNANFNTLDYGKKSILVKPKAPSSKQSVTTFSSEDDAKFLSTLLNIARNLHGHDSKLSSSLSSSNILGPSLEAKNKAFFQEILNGQSKIQLLSSEGSDKNNTLQRTTLLKIQDMESAKSSNSPREQFQLISLSKTTQRPMTITTMTTATTTRMTTLWRSPSSTYHPPLFSSFGAFSSSGGNSGSFDRGKGSVRSQVVNTAIGMTRAFGQFLGAAITGAAQQFQFFVRNGTTWG